MFSPGGKKKILLEIKRAKEMGVNDPVGLVLSRQDKSTTLLADDTNATDPHTVLVKKSSKKEGLLISTQKLEKLLEEKSETSKVLEKVLSSTKRYNPQKDQITMKLFQNKFIQVDLFREILFKAFWLSFENMEYDLFLNIFDPDDAGYIDGYQFMIVFTRLGAIRKDRDAQRHREKREEFRKKMNEENRIKLLESEKKNEIAADFDFDEEIKEDALKKISIAAKKFDPAHPASPSLDAFEGRFMTIATFREMLKRIFNLQLSGKELGAIITIFDDINNSDNNNNNNETAGAIVNNNSNVLSTDANEVNDNSIDTNKSKSMNKIEDSKNLSDGTSLSEDKTKDNDNSNAKEVRDKIGCNSFLRQFLRLGIEGREKDRKLQRDRQIEAEKMKIEEKKKLKSSEEDSIIDYSFNELDIARADAKLLEASTKYDKNAPGCQSLIGFECDSLTINQFRDLCKRVFKLVFSDKELGYVIRKYDKKGDQRITCSSFLITFLRIGQQERDRLRLLQLKKQKELIENEEKDRKNKMKSVIEKSSTFKIDYDYNEKDIDSAKHKLTDAALRFDKGRGGSLACFEPRYLTPLEFNRALKQTFDVKLSPTELGSIVVSLDKDGTGKVMSKDFITSFTAMGFQERSRKQLQQIKQSREAELKHIEESKAKRDALLNQGEDDYVDYDFTDDDRDVALQKMADAALKYDKSHPAAMSLDGFNCKYINAMAFKDLVRRTFNLRLSPKDTGVLITHFDRVGEQQIECSEFLTVFLQLGYQQRAEISSKQLEKQRAEDRARIEREAMMLEKTVNRAGSLKVNMDYTEEDAVSSEAKLLLSAKGFDKSHPAAPSLDAFDISVMTPGIFRENLKRCFGIVLNPSELGYCVATYGSKKDMTIDSPKFLITFLRRGKTARYAEHKLFLQNQRKLIKQAKLENEKKLKDQMERASVKIDLDACTADDLDSAIYKMTISSSKFHDPVSSVGGFTGGGMKAAEFRDLIRRSFDLRLSLNETAALVKEFNFNAPQPSNNNNTNNNNNNNNDGDANIDTNNNDEGSNNNTVSISDLIDSKKFLNKFMRLGKNHLSEMKNAHIEKQRQIKEELEKETTRKKKLAEQKMVTDIDWGYGEMDRSNVYTKLTDASAKYDKNAPGCVPLSAFDAQFLSPVVFRETMKRTFNISLAPKELAVLINDFDDSNGNLHCQSFIVYFLKIGIDERNKFKLIMLEKQRRENQMRKVEHERKLKEAEERNTLQVDYDHTEEEKDSAFNKLTVAAKKYDRSHPGSMSLDGFQQNSMTLGTFREMIKRTFGLILDGGEFGAIISYFDSSNTGRIVSHEFLKHFLRVGQAERNKDKTASLQKIREDAENRKKIEEDTLRAQWSKNEMKINQKYSDMDQNSVIEKVRMAAFKWDPSKTTPGGLKAFQAKFLSISVFREMLKRVFNLNISDAELAAIVNLYCHASDTNKIDCRLFMNDFTKFGFEMRSNARSAQVEKNRQAIIEAKTYHEKVTQEAENKVANVVDFKYSKSDFNNALQKINDIADKYELNHPSSPSLIGFRGGNMKAFQFKDMVMRTFAVALSSKELGALTKFYDTTGTNTVDTKEFLAHFMKLQRQGAERKRKSHLTKLRDVEMSMKIDEINKETKKTKDLLQLIDFKDEDKISFMSKIRKAAQDYAIDSAALQEPLQAFKGPALTPLAFIDTFRKAFHDIKFSLPEVGVLISIQENSGTNTLDGPRFLTWFYKLARKESAIMLGEVEDDVTFNSLKGSTRQKDIISTVKGSEKHANMNNTKSLKNMKKDIKKDIEFLFDDAPIRDTINNQNDFNSSVKKNDTFEDDSRPKGGKKLAMMLMSSTSTKELPSSNVSVLPISSSSMKKASVKSVTSSLASNNQSIVSSSSRKSNSMDETKKNKMASSKSVKRSIAKNEMNAMHNQSSVNGFFFPSL
jgi:hypothetical protein